MNLRLSQQRKTLVFAFGLASTLVLVAAITWLAAVLAPAAGDGAITGAPEAAVVSTPTLSAESFCTHWFALGADFPPDKRAGMQAAYNECVEARRSTASVSERLAAVRPRPKISPPPTPPPYIARADIPHRTLGNGTVLEKGESMFPGDILIENQWWETLGSQWIRVYAGAQRGDGANDLPKPWQGVVFVSMAGLDGTLLLGGGMFKTPKKVGSVKIVDAQGQRLVLKAEDGTLFYFDVPTRQFVSGLVPAAVAPVKPTVPPYP